MGACKKKKGLADTLRWAYPVAKYAAVLLIALNLHRLPAQVALLPGAAGPRWLLMIWVALLLAAGCLADRRAEIDRRKDEALQGNAGSGMNLLSFLALAVPGLLLLDAAAIAHVYYCWFQGGAADAERVHAAVMAAGCVLWIYGRALPDVPYGSVWGIRTKKTRCSAETWRETHKRYAAVFCVIGCLFLIAGALF